MLCKINQKFTYLALAPPFSNATVGFWSVGEKDSKQRIIYIQFTYHSLERNTKKDKKKERITPTTTLKKEKEKKFLQRKMQSLLTLLHRLTCIHKNYIYKIIFIYINIYIYYLYTCPPPLSPFMPFFFCPLVRCLWAVVISDFLFVVCKLESPTPRPARRPRPCQPPQPSFFLSTCCTCIFYTSYIH